ncbi:outer membrane lipoprotein-sorting protein [Streptomyces sp. 2333.5]|uniref:LolA family protein n=1 Tax=unclassified Streptomyces TaxID=2593676 RepID=UPI0008986E48|nr:MULTISPECIES: outer membrane lipoprotein carrier protein LolA [unclassified Streptomyces]PJJ02759.1 outer membrane lipoprotein-sorting protein [Streptomyces sp. 2333.5]SED25634.1 Outer membrane lipoprotein-sorting protein [Streptomyces sp. 2314.4]SEE13319.1 Outer membrane lipoprotein-sorting protein [Streptomyces sp. 2112.2]
MPRNEPTEGTDGWDGEGSPRRRKAVRYAVPVAVAGLAAATIGLVPAFAGSGSPDLPKISAQDLIAKMAKSDVQQLSGTVRASADLGLPSLPGGAGGAGAFGGGKGGDGGSADPQSKLMELASGAHTLRVAADGPDKQRVSIVDKAAEYSLVHNGNEVWGYDSGSNTAFHHTAPEAGRHGKQQAPKDLPKGLENATPQDLAKQALQAAGDTTSVTVDGTAKVAGRDAYQLLIKPKQTASTVGSIRIAVDAANGVPLKFTLTPKSGGAAAIDVGFTSVDFAKPAASTFAFTPPKGAKVVKGDETGATAQREHGKDGAHGKDMKAVTQDMGGLNVLGKGWTSIATIKGDGSGLPSGKGEGKGKGSGGDAAAFLDSIGDKVHGSFGSGRVFSTRLVNALVTDNGTLYVGAVDKQALIDAANAAK